jgi:hypothetical protein
VLHKNKLFKSNWGVYQKLHFEFMEFSTPDFWPTKKWGLLDLSYSITAQINPFFSFIFIIKWDLNGI